MAPVMVGGPSPAQNGINSFAAVRDGNVITFKAISRLGEIQRETAKLVTSRGPRTGKTQVIGLRHAGVARMKASICSSAENPENSGNTPNT